MTKDEERAPNEPTTGDLMLYFKDKMDGLDGKFGGFEARLNSFQSSMIEGFTKIHDRIEKVERVGRTLLKQQDTMTTRVDDISRQVTNLVYQTTVIQETLTDLSEAETKDALATINHERRIIRLENLANIKPSTLKHLKKG